MLVEKSPYGLWKCRVCYVFIIYIYLYIIFKPMIYTKWCMNCLYILRGVYVCINRSSIVTLNTLYKHMSTINYNHCSNLGYKAITPIFYYVILITLIFKTFILFIFYLIIYINLSMFFRSKKYLIYVILLLCSFDASRRCQFVINSFPSLIIYPRVYLTIVLWMCIHSIPYSDLPTCKFQKD